MSSFQKKQITELYDVDYQIWKKPEFSQKFLSGVRMAFPSATEEIETMLKIIQMLRPLVNNFLDLGCGDGILGGAILSQYPDSQGVFLDFSDTMIAQAKSKLTDFHHGNLEFINGDYSLPNWVNTVEKKSPFDLVVSGFSIHHQQDTRKQEIYQEIYQLLKPEGLFLNLDRVSSPSELMEKLFDELLVDYIYAFHQSQNQNKSREETRQYHNTLRIGDIPTPLETQCNWLKEIGFIHVDCYMKWFDFALFGGIKSKAITSSSR